MKGMGKTILCIKEGGLEDPAQTGCRVLNRLGRRESYNQGQPQHKLFLYVSFAIAFISGLNCASIPKFITI